MTFAQPNGERKAVHLSVPLVRNWAEKLRPSIDRGILHRGQMNMAFIELMDLVRLIDGETAEELTSIFLHANGSLDAATASLQEGRR